MKPKYEKKKFRGIDNILCSCAIPVQKYGIVEGKKKGGREKVLSSGVFNIALGRRVLGTSCQGQRHPITVCMTRASGRRTRKAYCIIM
jgi:hypothetical protein